MTPYSIYVAGPPPTEPVTVAEAKALARISHSVEDALIGGWIKTARELAEKYQHRAYVKQSLFMSFDSYPETPFSLPRPPAWSIDTVQIIDVDGSVIDLYRHGGAGLMQSDFVIDTDSQPGRVDLKSGKSWPSIELQKINGFQILYYAGYGETGADTPATVKDAIALYCAWRNENRTAEVDAPPHFYNLLTPDRIFS